MSCHIGVCPFGHAEEHPLSTKASPGYCTPYRERTLPSFPRQKFLRFVLLFLSQHPQVPHLGINVAFQMTQEVVLPMQSGAQGGC